MITFLRWTLLAIVMLMMLNPAFAMFVLGIAVIIVIFASAFGLLTNLFATRPRE
jgi:hypothetical protein